MNLFNMKFFRLIFFFVFTIFMSSAVEAVGPFAYSAIKEGIGARAYAMGGAYTAVAEEGPALFYNPAGLATPGFLYEYETLSGGKGLSFSDYRSHQLYMSPLAFDYWKKESGSGDSVEVVSLGFGKRTKGGIDWGVNYHSMNVNEGGVAQQGWGADIGVLARLNQNMTVGFTAHDLFKQNLELPTTFAAGFALSTLSKNFTFATDLVSARENNQTTIRGRYGMEYALSDGLILRGGYFDSTLTGGIGLGLGIIELDYTMLYPQNNASQASYMIGFRLGKGAKNQEARRRYALFKPKTYAEFSMGSNIVQGKSEISLMNGVKVGSNDLLGLIHEASLDDQCEGFVIRMGNLQGSLSAISLVQDVRRELLKAKQAGKTIVVYLDGWATLPEYYLASVANKIVLPELGTISHLGLAVEVLKTKRFLNNFGFDTTIVASGKHKASLSPEGEAMTAEDKALYEDILNNLYRQVLLDIQASRKLSWDKVKYAFDGRLISAKEAQRVGLIDGIGYYTDVKEGIPSTNVGQKGSQIKSLYSYAESEEDVMFPLFNKIAVIEIDGTLVSGYRPGNFLTGAKETGAETIDQVVKAIQSDFAIQGVLLRVNSPGGSMLAADQMYQAIGKLRKAGKTVYTSMGGVAASGGYYIALNSDKIYSNPGTLTGSVGVISFYPNQEGFQRLLGIKREALKTGDYMDIFSPNKKMTAKEKKMLSEYQQEHYAVFVDRLSSNRFLNPDEALVIAQGQAVTGEQALKLKMVDKLGNFYDAVDDLAKETGIKGKPELVYFRTEPPALLTAGWLQGLPDMMGKMMSIFKGE